MAPRFTYNSSSITVDIDRDDFNAYEDLDAHRRQESESLSGIREYTSFSTRKMITCELRSIPGQTVNELEEWFSFVKDGTTFEFERDKDHGAYHNFEGKSLTDNNGSAGTFTRDHTSATAYYSMDRDWETQRLYRP